ncbi:hypothetical protein GOBAR_AA24226 [Gossypium barbadense]|uniref:Uncharacterized protein n=1 Tax=Gossypium barbadense TaxID=3634 RepID=A0A2P5WZD2_GOSBA|nr:hypothetical protein GOBAR_AA24226 [Gossypium barbadense]
MVKENRSRLKLNLRWTDVLLCSCVHWYALSRPFASVSEGLGAGGGRGQSVSMRPKLCFVSVNSRPRMEDGRTAGLCISRSCRERTPRGGEGRRRWAGGEDGEDEERWEELVTEVCKRRLQGARRRLECCLRGEARRTVTPGLQRVLKGGVLCFGENAVVVLCTSMRGGEEARESGGNVVDGRRGKSGEGTEAAREGEERRRGRRVAGRERKRGEVRVERGERRMGGEGRGRGERREPGGSAGVSRGRGAGGEPVGEAEVGVGGNGGERRGRTGERSRGEREGRGSRGRVETRREVGEGTSSRGGGKRGGEIEVPLREEREAEEVARRGGVGRGVRGRRIEAKIGGGSKEKEEGERERRRIEEAEGVKSGSGGAMRRVRRGKGGGVGKWMERGGR